jgi:hypothetical protein
MADTPMKTISFADDTEREKGLWVIVLNGPVVYPGNKKYEVPDYILKLLDQQGVRYSILNHSQNGASAHH